MSIVRVEAQLSTDELLKAVGDLPLPELAQFVEQVLALQARRRAPHLPQDETALLLKINEKLPADLQQRYDVLSARRRAETLTPEEHEELLRLIQEIQWHDVRRAENLAELARLRGVSLSALMDSLGIHTLPYV